MLSEPQTEALLQYANNIIATLRESFLVLDKNLQVISANQTFYATFKVTEKETLGRLLPDVGGKQWDIPGLLILLKEILPEKKAIKDYEVKHEFEHIGERIMSLNACQVRIPKKIAGIIKAGIEEEEEEEEEELILLAIEDITESKLAGDGIKKSESRFRAIFHEAPLGIALIDSLTGHIYEVNSRFAEIAGRTIAEMANIDWMSIAHPDDVQKDLDNMTLLNAGKIKGFSMEKRYRHPDGSYVWVNMTITPITSEDKRSSRHLCMIDDITERKEMEESLHQSEERYRGIVDNIGIGVALISPEMEVLSLNNQMKKWNPHIDLRDKHVCYRSFNNPPREEICSYCPTAKTLKDGLVHEALTETPMGGQIYNYRVVSSPIKDESGKVVAVIEMVEDFTERKRMEGELRGRVKELEVFYKAAMGRERRIIELKEEIRRLSKDSGK